MAGGGGLITGREVSGTDEPFMTCLENGTVPKLTEVVNHGEWLKWRKGPGRRPVKSAGEATTTAVFEAQLWRATMEGLFGPDWRVLLEEKETSQATRVEESGADETDPSSKDAGQQQDPKDDVSEVATAEGLRTVLELSLIHI